MKSSFKSTVVKTEKFQVLQLTEKVQNIVENKFTFKITPNYP